ncbi:MAG: hypothetical protein ACHP85_01925 [Burkholderiales bacterium]|jgi:hypothetical protein
MVFADYAGVSAVLRRTRMTQRPYAEWESIWAGAPFAAKFADVPIGWVLENAAKEVVGTLSNVHSEYWYGGRPLRAAIAASWAVDGDYRSHALALKSKFFSQRNVDVLLNGSASQRTAQLLPAFKATPVPHASYDEVLFWITGYHGFARSALRKTGRPWMLAVSPLLGAAWWTLDSVTRAPWAVREPEVTERRSFDEAFDRFWAKLSMHPNRLLALRSREALEWRLKHALAQDRARILVLERNSEIDGYLLLLRSDSEAHGLRRYLVADLQVIDETGRSTHALLVAGLRLARREGLHMLEMTGFNAQKRQWALRLSPYVRKLGWSRFYVKVCRPELREPLAAIEAWDASPFDSDDTI